MVKIKKNLKHYILILTAFTIISAAVGQTICTFFISKKYTTTARYQILNRYEDKNRKKKDEYASNYTDLLTSDEFMEFFSKNCSLKLSARELSGITKIKPVKKSCWLDVSFTSTSKSDSYLLQQEFESTTGRYKKLAPYRFEIVIPAQIPEKPSVPDMSLNLLISSMAGLIAGGIFLLIIPKQHPLIENEKDVLSVTKIPVIAKIPVLINQTEPEITLDMCHNAYFKNSFDNLLKGIQKLSDERCSVITVCSPSKGDGKTTVAVNLAIAAAQSGMCVLLLDCNFRNTAFQKYFNIEDDEPGFSDIISNRAKIKTALKTTEHDSLFVLPSGTAGINPAGTLIESKSKSIISKLKPMFDLIITDTPDLNSYSDAMTLKEITNAYILTLNCESASDEDLRHTLKGFELSDVSAKGIVLNRCSVKEAVKNPVNEVHTVRKKVSSDKNISDIKSKNEFINMKL